jgi:hypothetical protein
MGVYDFVLLEKGIDLPEYPIPEDKHRITWQTRAFSDPMYRLHCISESGHLYRADHNYDEMGFAESYGETGSFEFIEILKEEEYNGYPRDNSSMDWYRIRYTGDMRITAQNNEGELVMYDIEFDRHSISDISPVDPQNIERSIRSKMGDLKGNDVEEGQIVYDRNQSEYRVIDVIEQPAKNVTVNPEVKERGHTIYEEKTVADLNPEYPEDDIVIKLERKDAEKTVYFPVSRIAVDHRDIF